MRAAPIQVELYLVQHTEYDADGWLGIQPDAYGEQGAATHQAVYPYGISGCPLDPVTDAEGNIQEGCPTLGFWHGGQCLLLPLNDTRHIPGLPTLRAGESLQYGPAGNYVRCHSDGSISMMGTSDGTITGQTVSYKQGPAGQVWVGPWGTQKFDANFWEIKHHSKASIIMGGIAGIPDPLGEMSTYCIIRAAQFKVKASIVAFGPDTGVKEPLAKALSLSLILAETGTAIAALQAALASLTVASGGQAAAAISAPLVAPAVTSLGGSLPLMQSASVSAT